MSATAQEQKIISPLRPCFSIHKEYIHYEGIDGEDEVTPRKELYPLFMSGQEFRNIIKKEYANINWYGLNDNVVDIITKNGVLTMILFTEEDGNLYHGGENAHIDHPIALQTDHPKLLFFQRV
jgi:hypothetical protein